MAITYQVTVYDDRTIWTLNEKIHNESGPAVEYKDGSKLWYKDGQRHRDGDLPAVEYADGHKEFFNNGKRHREDGPAIEYVSGGKEWYIKGKNVSEEEHKRFRTRIKEVTMSQLEELLGYSVVIVKEAKESK